MKEEEAKTPTAEVPGRGRGPSPGRGGRGPSPVRVSRGPSPIRGIRGNSPIRAQSPSRTVP